MVERLNKELVEERVRALCLSNPEISGRKIAQRYRQKHGNRPRERTIQAIVTKVRIGFPDEPFIVTEWRSWRDEESPEERASLLRLDAVCQSVMGRRLWQHEAHWGKRLRVMLLDLNEYDRFCFTHLYAERQRSAYYQRLEVVYTDDLDSIMVYQPWVSKNGPIWLASQEFDEPIPPEILYPPLDIPGVNIPPPAYEYLWQHALEPPLIIGYERPSHWREGLEYWMGSDSIFPEPIVLS